jgi:hypothetical protein
MVHEKRTQFVTARVSPQLAALVKRVAEQQKRSISYIIEEILRDALITRTRKKGGKP